MAHCLLLAALLHLWLVLVLGNAAGGTAAPGQGVWGAINVRLQLRAPVSDSPQMVPPVKPEPGGAPGQAVAERWGGAVRPQGPVPEAEPGAAKLGTWGLAPSSSPVDSAALAAPPSLTAAELPALPQLAATAVSTVVPPAPPAPPAQRQLASPLSRPAPATTAAPTLAHPNWRRSRPWQKPRRPAPAGSARCARCASPPSPADLPAGEQAAALAKPLDVPLCRCRKSRHRKPCRTQAA
jgi:Meckel syndrome type 1 protein